MTPRSDWLTRILQSPQALPGKTPRRSPIIRRVSRAFSEAEFRVGFKSWIVRERLVMVIIKPVDQARIFKITLSGVSITVSWPAPPASERREHAEEAYYLAAFLAGHEKREYGIYLDGDPVPVVTVNPLALEEGTYVDHACCYE